MTLGRRLRSLDERVVGKYQSTPLNDYRNTFLACLALTVVLGGLALVKHLPLAPFVMPVLMTVMTGSRWLVERRRLRRPADSRSRAG